MPHLIAAVYVQDPSTREELILLPCESPDPEIAALVTNPDAWDVPPDGDEEEADPEPVSVGEPDPTAGHPEPDQEQGEAGGGGPKKPQPRRSRSSAS
ncbi:hypothetical protein OHA61_17070 [Streptomyces sp. NBC_00885]|uniref:hypothetical protein n=1 Tax=Streptomyces sp. NBC_00885 TaxID=2975857 RepID=UPI003870AB69|nr:hypothetical protein OHA61_17070 [Streptomyces sp. NBC_00885]